MFKEGFSALGRVAILTATSALTSANAAMVVSAGATQNVACASGTCSATAANAVLNIRELNTALRRGDVTLAPGSQAQDLVIAVPLHWTSTHTLTMDAWRGITINRPVQVQGGGGLSMTVNDGGAGGFLSFAWNASVSFLGTANTLTVNGNAYTLAPDLPSLIAAANANPTGFFALSKSYDAHPDGVYTSSPIPISLLGGFEGLGNKIDGLQMNATGIANTIGLFNIVGLDAVIENLRLTHLKYTAGSRNGLVSNAGAIAGINLGTIRNTTVLGSVRGFNATLSGGIAGLNSGNIVRVRVSGPVSGLSAGGIAGQNTGTIRESFTTGYVRSTGNLLGLVAGGIAGGNLLGTIDQSYSRSLVSGVNVATLGGIAGNNTGTVSNTYATGSVAGGAALSTVGGLVGSNIGSIAQSYATGAVTGGTLASVGGLIGTDLAIGGVASGYWDTTTSGTTKGVGNQLLGEQGVTGLTDSQLKAALPNGFSTQVWTRDASRNSSMPYLLELPPN